MVAGFNNEKSGSCAGEQELDDEGDVEPLPKAGVWWWRTAGGTCWEPGDPQGERQKTVLGNLEIRREEGDVVAVVVKEGNS